MSTSAFSRQTSDASVLPAAAAFVVATVLMIASSAIAGQDSRPLKYVVDDAHHRVYLLVRDGVEIRELASGGRHVTHVDLPEWTWVSENYSCPPGIALTPEGDVLVTSNVVPTVWRIERLSLATTKHDLALDQDRGRDVGFTRLRWAENLRAFVATTEFGDKWYVDPSLSTAREVLSAPIKPPLRPCH